MGLRFRTDSPNTLLKKFIAKINQDEQEGKIETWGQYGGGFRHTSKNWKDLGLFKATVSEDNLFLVFNLTKCEGDYTYAYYHGHLLQTFIEHLNSNFEFSKYADKRTSKKK